MLGGDPAPGEADSVSRATVILAEKLSSIWSAIHER
jgi:hypothetical protein